MALSIIVNVLELLLTISKYCDGIGVNKQCWKTHLLHTSSVYFTIVHQPLKM